MTNPPRNQPPDDTPPWDPEYDSAPPTIEHDGRLAERLLIGSILTRPELAASLLPAIDPTDFHNPTFELLWETAADLHAQDRTPDQLAIQQALSANDIFTRNGGPSLLLQLRDEAPFAPEPDRYAQAVRNAARWRRVGAQLNHAQVLHRAARPDDFESALNKLVDVTERAALTFGPRQITPEDTGLRDLSWLRSGQAPNIPPPVYVRRDDGTALFYKGKVNGLFGDPESAKSWLAQIAVVEALNHDGAATYIDLDHNGMDATAARLMLLGARPDHLWDPDRFRYYDPEDDRQLRNAAKETARRAPDVYVLDSLGEVLPLLGMASKDNDEVTLALRSVVQPAADAGTCVITIDHLPKGTEARSSGFAIGGMAKKRAIRGAYLRVNSKVKPSPGGIGRSVLLIEKDSTGELRKTCAGGYAGELTLDSTHAAITRWSVSREHSPVAEDGTFRPTELMEKISRYLEDSSPVGQSRADIQDTVGGKHTTIDTALAIMLNEGFIGRVKGRRNAWVHSSTSPYRITEDDRAHPPRNDDEPPNEELF